MWQNFFYKNVPKSSLYSWEFVFSRKFFSIKVSQRSAFICEKISPYPYWCKAYVFILILVFMIGKKLQRIEKIGVNFFGGGFGGKGEECVSRTTKTHYCGCAFNSRRCVMFSVSLSWVFGLCGSQPPVLISSRRPPAPQKFSTSSTSSYLKSSLYDHGLWVYGLFEPFWPTHTTWMF